MAAKKKTEEKDFELKDYELKSMALITKATYDAFCEVGFTKKESFELVKTVLKSPAMMK